MSKFARSAQLGSVWDIPLMHFARYILRLYQRSAANLIKRAERAELSGDRITAAALYRRALALAPDETRVGIRVRLARTLRDLMRYDEAEATLRQAFAERPNDGEICLQLGHLLKLIGRNEDAIEAYSMAHRRLPKDYDVAADIGALGAGADEAAAAVAVEKHISEADRLRDAHRYAEAAAMYGITLGLAPGRTDIRIQHGNMLKDSGQLTEAEAAYLTALEHSPEEAEIHLQLGHVLKLQDRRSDALLSYRRAVKIQPALDAAWSELFNAGSDEDAAAAYEAALQLVPTRTTVHLLYATVLKDAGRLGEAESVYRSAIARNPDDAELHLQLGHILKLQGRRNEALAAYRRASEINPSLDAAWDELFEGGCPEAQRQLFDIQVGHGGVDAFLTVTEQLAVIQRTIGQLMDQIPALSARVAFPLGAYDRFRSLYDVPIPPSPRGNPRFSIVLVAEGSELATLYSQLSSVSGQTYRYWQLMVLGTDAAQRRAVERAAASDPRIAWVAIADDESPWAVEHRTALAGPADWILLPGPGALLHRQALGWFAAAAGEGAIGFVTDEETVTVENGAPKRSSPELRHVVDYDTLLEANPFGETVVVERAAYQAISESLAVGSLPAARSSLLLHLAHRGTVGHIPLPLVAREASHGAEAGARSGNEARSEAASAAHESAVRLHLAAVDLEARIAVRRPSDMTSPLSVSWQPSVADRPVEVIIPTRDNAGDLRKFVDSLRTHAAVPAALRVLIVDNGSRLAESAQILAELNAREWVRVVELDEPFNWSRLNNQAAAQTRSELLVFANDDMLMLSDGWDRQLRGLLERPEIGAVGARLLYPDSSIQHAGMLLGWPSGPVHDGRDASLAEPGPCRRWHVSRAVGAVTGAFLGVRHAVFDEVGGFDEIGLPVAYSDIDFALRVRTLGLKILWSPSLTLRHYESKSRGLDHLSHEKAARYAAEFQLMRDRWGAALLSDPDVNPNWHVATRPFRLVAAPPQPRLWHHIRMCASPNPWAVNCGAETS